MASAKPNRRRVQNRLALRRLLLPRHAAVSSCGGNRVVVRPETWDQTAHMACALPDPFESRLSYYPCYAFGLPVARVTRSGQVQLLPGPLVFGQVFGPPCGGTWPPLCAPPTI
jgi:hypothetical protein